MTVTPTLSVTQLIQAVDQADSPERLVAAVTALVAAHTDLAIPALIAVLGYNNPAAAAIALQGLVQLGDQAVPQLIEQLDDYNYGARAYSVRALAAIGHPQALDLLQNAAESDFAPSVRRAAARGLGQLRWSLLPLPEQLSRQQQVYQTFLTLLADDDWSIRYAAVVGLQGLGSATGIDTELTTQIHQQLVQLQATDRDSAIQLRVQQALAQLLETTSPSS